MNYVAQRQDMIDASAPRAAMTGFFAKVYINEWRHKFGRVPWRNEDFQYVPWHHFQNAGYTKPILHQRPYYVKRDDAEFIRFLFNQDCCVDVGNFRPMPGKAKTIAPPPVVLEEKPEDANSTEFPNATPVPVARTRENEDHQVVTSGSEVARELGVKAGLQLRQLISYGGDASPVSGETEITASVETSVSDAQKKSESEEKGKRDTGSYSLTIPPWGVLEVDRQMFRTKKRQEAHIEGDLDWTTWMWSRDDFEYCWESRRDLEAAFKGVAATGQGNWLNDQLAKAPMPSVSRAPFDMRIVDRIVAPLVAKFTISHDYDASTRTRITTSMHAVEGHEAEYKAAVLAMGGTPAAE